MSPRTRAALLVVGLAGLGSLLVVALLLAPASGRDAHPYGEAAIQNSVVQRHTPNVVSSINFDQRGFDTLGEEFLLFASVLGAVILLRPSPGDRRIVPVERDGHRFAALVYDASLDDDPELVEAVSAAAAIALENEELHAESEARLAELQASRERIVTAGDDERRRLERNLHDGAQQRLVALSMQLRLLQGRIREDPTTAEALVTTASDELARGLHPAVLDHGLEPAIESLASRSPVPTTVSCEAVGTLPRPVELAAYFVASEALTNVAKYARATVAQVRLTCERSMLVVEIADDGAGGADAMRGSGLSGLVDRVEALEGRLTVVSPPGEGTLVRAELPCGS